MKRKTGKDKIRRFLRFLCGLAALSCLGYFAVYCFMSNNSTSDFDRLSNLREKDSNDLSSKPPVTVHLNKDLETPDMLEEFATVYVKNKSVVGWISIEDTQIDYPVMQSTNEEYYLDHNFEQEKDNNGSIFLDSSCSIWPRSDNLIIYGHNMKSGKMFGSLDNYKQKDYYEKHKIIRFDSLYESGNYQVMYVFNDVIREESEVAFKYYQFIDANSAEEYQSNMNEMAKMSMYDTGVSSGYGDELITLSTCDYSGDQQRFVVVAKKIN